MTIMIRVLMFLIVSLMLFSCNGSEVVDRMDGIKAIGNKDPKLATKMLDSVYTDIVDASEYTKMKYELLRVRLNDKNDVIPTSNRMVEVLKDYFNSNGTSREKQEAYFYAGSVYRDLDDTPRAIENFYNSIEAIKESDECDTVLLRNAYSNLFCLFTNVQDDSTALEMADKEYFLSRKINDMTIHSIMHWAESLVDDGQKKRGEKYLDEAFDSIRLEKYAEEDNYIYILLSYYSNLKLKDKANECYALIRRRGLKRNDAFVTYIFGSYYEQQNLPDSAIACYLRIFNEGDNEYAMYDASKKLFHLYSQRGNLAAANRYGAEFIRLSKELDLSKNQKLAATVNNKYKYNLDRKYVQDVEQGRTMYMRATVVVSVSLVLLALLFVIFYILKRNKTLRQQIAVNMKLGEAKEQYKKAIEKLAENMQQLNNVKAELAASTEQLRHSNADIDRYTADLQKAKNELAEKRRQSQTLMQMLHRTEFSVQAEDVVISVKEAARGRRKLEGDDWQQLYAAVDSLYPGFRDILTERLGTFSEQQMQVCYLMRIGLNNPQIKNVSDVPRTTIWRWTKAYGWIYGLPGAQ